MAKKLLVADSVNRVRHFAVAFRLTQHGTHAGILYRCPVDNQIYLLHFGAAGEVRREPWSASYAWCALNLLHDELYQLSQLCKLIVDLREEIPYGVSFKCDTRFCVNTGHLELNTAQKGLTCATFVLALLNGFNINLIDTETWPPASAADLQYIADYFPDDVEIALEFPCSRYKPQEVAGACLVDNMPVVYEMAIAKAEEVMADISYYLDRKRVGY